MQTACDLELWQEAFRSVEDIQGLMALGKKTPKPQLMAIYYARLTRIFTVSGSHLYNGYAWCACLPLLWAEACSSSLHCHLSMSCCCAICQQLAFFSRLSLGC